jgi:predicted ester cyclase
MPDWQFTMEDVIAEGARIAIRWSAHGTQHGPLLGVAPTGKPLHLTGISIYHLVGRTIVEGWTSWDTLSVLRQLGRFPALERARGGAAMPNVM